MPNENVPGTVTPTGDAAANTNLATSDDDYLDNDGQES
jgi:hypothetical protein